MTFVNGVSGGLLLLDDPLNFGGLVAGFGGDDEIDLRGLSFVSGGMTVSFVEAGSHTSGTLTVSNGTSAVNLTLLGQYAAGQFSIADDAFGGTLVSDPPVSGGGIAVAGPLSVHT